MKSPLFTGVCPALVTPFYESGKIDFTSFEKQLERQLEAGVDAVCVCGTTGEASTLSPEERAELISACVAQVDGRVKVIVGSGSNDTASAIRYSHQAESQGADALLLVTPYYNKTSQAGLMLHFSAICAETDLPVILYNVPSRTGVSIAAETYAALASDPKIIGVKEASGDLSLFTKTRMLCGDDFFVWSGNDDQTVSMMSLGAKGVISAVCNLIPDVMVRMTHLCMDGRFDEASNLQIHYSALIDLLFCEVNPIPVKFALSALGLDSGTLRLPLCAPTKEHRSMLRFVLQQYDLF